MRKLMMIVVLALTAGLSSTYGQDMERFEALFIHKFGDYIKWPESTNPKIVGILDNNKVLNELDKIGASSGKIKTIALDGLSKISDCDIVYIGNASKINLAQAAATAKSNHILLVTKGEEHVGKGSCIGFYTKGGRLKFAISPKTIEAYDLKASTALVSLGKMVD